jgi:hypothetical protein
MWISQIAAFVGLNEYIKHGKDRLYRLVHHHHHNNKDDDCGCNNGKGGMRFSQQRCQGYEL